MNKSKLGYIGAFTFTLIALIVCSIFTGVMLAFNKIEDSKVYLLTCANVEGLVDVEVDHARNYRNGKSVVIKATGETIDLTLEHCILKKR